MVSLYERKDAKDSKAPVVKREALLFYDHTLDALRLADAANPDKRALLADVPLLASTVIDSIQLGKTHDVFSAPGASAAVDSNCMTINCILCASFFVVLSCLRALTHCSQQTP